MAVTLPFPGFCFWFWGRVSQCSQGWPLWSTSEGGGFRCVFLCLVYGVRGLKTGTVCMPASTPLTIPQPPSLSSSSYRVGLMTIHFLNILILLSGIHDSGTMIDETLWVQCWITNKWYYSRWLRFCLVSQSPILKENLYKKEKAQTNKLHFI